MKSANIPVYDARNSEDRQKLVDDLRNSYIRAAENVSRDESKDPEDNFVNLGWSDPVIISESEELIGIDPSVYRQINAALAARKQHLMLYGPPGTGKTTLAQHISKSLHDSFTMITGSADWTSQDVIGGYQPVGEGKVRFIPGVLLKNFDRPLIIDELNRCDIDKVLGPLFTVLSGQMTTLPYRTDISDEESDEFVILPEPTPVTDRHEFAPDPDWRIIATINSIDKAALYQMSFALTRRFGWIYVDIPDDLQEFLLNIMRQWRLIGEGSKPQGEMAMTKIWKAVNKARVIGPAPFLDMLKTIHQVDREIDFAGEPAPDQAVAYLDSFYMYVLPMLDGIEISYARDIAADIQESLQLPEENDFRTLQRRLEALAV